MTDLVSTRRSDPVPVAAAIVATATDEAPGAEVAPAGRLAALEDHLRDGLTGLGSILTLRVDLEQLIDRYQPFGARPALLTIDIDRFAEINDTFGRPIGDEVLRATAGRLARVFADGRSAYRTGGDEFMAVVGSVAVVDAVEVARQLLSVLSTPVGTSSGPVPMSVSVAVVMLGHRHRVDGLLRDADLTMYRAKSEGGHRVDVYNWEVDSWSSARKRQVQRLEEEVEELRRKNRMLADAVTHDVVTGLPNAVAFDADHIQMDAWRKRSGEPYSVLRARIDGVDQMRPYLRAPAGTDAMVAVARAVRDTVRQSDRAYLLGEGDYAVLLRGTVMKQALGAAGRIQSRVTELAIANPARSGETLSITIAAVEAGFRHQDRHEVVLEADRLLAGGGPAPGQLLWPR